MDSIISSIETMLIAIIGVSLFVLALIESVIFHQSPHTKFLMKKDALLNQQELTKLNKKHEKYNGLLSVLFGLIIVPFIIVVVIEIVYSLKS